LGKATTPSGVKGEKGKMRRGLILSHTNGWFKKLLGISDRGVHIVPTIF